MIMLELQVNNNGTQFNAYIYNSNMFTLQTVYRILLTLFLGSGLNNTNQTHESAPQIRNIDNVPYLFYKLRE